MTRPIADRPFQFRLMTVLVVMSVAAFAFGLPAIAFALGMAFPLLFLGAACARSALVHRGQGWVCGLSLGAMFLIVGVMLASVLVFLSVNEWG